MAAMTEEHLSSLVNELVRECENYRDELSKDRITAMEYYDGIMRDVPHEADHSKVVSRDVRSSIRKVAPSVIRTILGNDKVVEYEPVGQDDEESSKQATDYVNFVVFPESDGYEAVQDSVIDALKLRNGVIRWWYDKKVRISVSDHTGLDEAAVVQLVQDDEVTVIEQSQYMQQVDTPEGPQEIPLFDLKIRRRSEQGCTKLAAVPPEEFLVHPDTLDIESGPVCGINMRLKRSDLVAMGYDRAVIDKIPSAAGNPDKDDEESTRRRDIRDEQNPTQKAMQEVEYYELYVRVDFDDDGIAELRRIVYAGAIKEKYMLENEECDEVPFADIVCERRPHEREGNSITDETKEIQKIKTVLLRQTLDNIYWQNMPQPIVQEGAVVNPESVINPKFGLPIRVGEGKDVRAALGFTQVPFVAQQSFSMLAYLDQEATDRTGISDASSGMAPDALQNMTAKATSLIEQAGIGQTELMVRTIAHGLKRVFRGLLKLVIKHQDKPRTVRLKGKWVQFDPRQWNSEMDATVNTGLGAGTRERDMMMMNIIIGLQEKLLTALGPVDNPFVSADNLYNAISRQVEAAGLKSPDLYFSQPTPEQLEQKKKDAANQPNPEMEKVKAQIEGEKAKAAAQMQIQAQKNQSDAQLQKMKQEQDMQLQQEKTNSELSLKRYQIDAELRLKQEQMNAELAMKAAFGAQQAAQGANGSGVHVGGEPG